MGRGYFMGCYWLGIAAALIVFFPLGAKRRACIPSLAWWLCLIVGAAMCAYGLSHSTAPSFATRISAVGNAYDCVERKSGLGFRFIPVGGESVDLETAIIIPGWAAPEKFDSRTYRVVYLRDSERSVKNEAIDIAILAGDRAGFHDSLDARPAGVWLAIPIGAAMGVFGFFGIRYAKDDAKSATSKDSDTASA
jgi:hypothetical protein